MIPVYPDHRQREAMKVSSSSSEFARLSDAALLAAIAVAHDKARNAPRNIVGSHDEPMLNSTGDSYARFGDEWARLRREARRRGLRFTQ